ncbi:MAG: hypothetical protein AUJ57_01210 [Zetaproteobacteria bacterium CG1_02_53_45]|nr:MAG: hypothetical protein AUJ57_01210 [Zetaproteobacteria bacterium CG1_02_53_45]
MNIQILNLKGRKVSQRKIKNISCGMYLYPGSLLRASSTFIMHFNPLRTFASSAVNHNER